MKNRSLLVAFIILISFSSIKAQDSGVFPEQKAGLNVLSAASGLLAAEYRMKFPLGDFTLSPGLHIEFYIPVFPLVFGDSWGFRTLVDSKLYGGPSAEGLYAKMGAGCGFTGMGNYFLDSIPGLSVSFYDQKTKSTFTQGLEYFCFAFTGGAGYDMPINEFLFIDFYLGTVMELRLQPDSASYYGRPDAAIYLTYAW
jgi:hypothetical protein